MKVFIGYDAREDAAARVCRKSIERHSPGVEVEYIDAESIPQYHRPFDVRDGQLMDGVTGQPFSTHFAYSRFLVPYLCNYEGWALFCDCDFLFLDDVRKIMKYADDSYAVMCVQHDYTPDTAEKMDGCIQTEYFRKLWSAFTLWNCSHPSNRKIGPPEVNGKDGLWLHQFQWLEPEEIGPLPEEWAWTVGKGHHISPTQHYRDSIDIKAVHMTEGGPWFEGFENVPYASEWKSYL